MALDLGAQSENETTVGVGVEIPGGVRHHGRRTRESDGDRRRKFDPFRGEDSECQRRGIPDVHFDL